MSKKSSLRSQKLSENLITFQKSKTFSKIWKLLRNLKNFWKFKNLPKNLKFFQKIWNVSKIWKFSENLTIFCKSCMFSKNLSIVKKFQNFQKMSTFSKIVKIVKESLLGNFLTYHMFQNRKVTMPPIVLLSYCPHTLSGQLKS